MIFSYFCFILQILFAFSYQSQKYTPDWNSLDSRPLPKWYDDSKFGIFIHWGVFSVPSFSSEWFWWAWKGSKEQSVIDFMNKNYPPGFSYADFANQFTAEFFDPNEWTEIIKASGAKYVVLTAKHHEGYCNWPSLYSWNWNSMDVGSHRDLVGDLANAIRNNSNIKFGLYHSLYEWFNRFYLNDKQNQFKTQDFVMKKTYPELYELINKYKPEVIWSDGDWEAPDSYWNSTTFLAWLYNDSPVKDTIVTNDRWGSGIMCNHGDFYTCSDNYNPGVLLKHKWENCMTLDKKSWGFRRNMNMEDIKTIEEVLLSLISTVSCGGNLLLNIGPTKDGKIPPIFEERLRQIGFWLSINGVAIYETKPWKHQNDTVNKNIWYTYKDGIVYAFVINVEHNDSIYMDAPITNEGTTISLLGHRGPIFFDRVQNHGLEIHTFKIGYVTTKWVWVFELRNVS